MFHEDYLPTSRGFDKFVGSYSGSSQHTSHEKCFHSPQRESPFTFCGYDMREAEVVSARNSTGGDSGPVSVTRREIIRFDLNGTHSNELVTDEIEKTLGLGRIRRNHKASETLAKWQIIIFFELIFRLNQMR